MAIVRSQAEEARHDRSFVQIIRSRPPTVRGFCVNTRGDEPTDVFIVRYVVNVARRHVRPRAQKALVYIDRGDRRIRNTGRFVVTRVCPRRTRCTNGVSSPATRAKICRRERVTSVAKQTDRRANPRLSCRPTATRRARTLPSMPSRAWRRAPPTRTRYARFGASFAFNHPRVRAGRDGGAASDDVWTARRAV